MEQQLEIKPVVISEHYDEIWAMMDGLHQHEQTLFSRTARWADFGANYMRHVIAMQEDCDGTCLVAYLNGRPAGFIFAYVEDEDDSRTEVWLGKELYVSDGYVAPEARGQGIYRKLNHELEQMYIAQGVRRICRFTLVNNTKIRNLLESEGYEVSRVLYEKWL